METAMNWSESLGMEKPRQRKRSHVPCPRHPLLIKGDGFAPYPSRACVSPSGYCRAEHSFIVDGAEGMRCCFCDALEPEA